VRYNSIAVKPTSLRGVIRGRVIELESDPHLPDGAHVEVELRLPDADPLWGLLADKPDLVEELRRVYNERGRQPWRTSDEAGNS
jgi:hypothetical protein